MNEFVQMEELTQGINGHQKYSKPAKPSQLRDHYNQLESSLSSKIEDISQQQQAVEEAPIQQVQKPAPKFKLTLPQMVETDSAQQRNMSVKNKRVMIQPAPTSTLKQSKTAGHLKIIDLQDHIQEEIAENIQYSIAVKPEKLAFKQEQVPQMVNQEEKESVYEQSNSFLDVKQEKQLPEPSNEPNQPIQHMPAQNNFLSDQYQKSRLFSKITQKEAPITKGAFVEKKNSHDDYQYLYPDNSKQTLDSGLQVTSIYSSRDEMSTRNILLPSLQKNSTSKRYKLPELKPYKQALESKLYEIPSQTLLKEETQKQAPSPKKKVKMTRERQVVIKSSYITNVSDFVKNPVPYGKRLECTLSRNKTCCIGCFLDYDLRTTDGKYLLSCKKMPYCLNSTYNISLQPGMFQQKSGPFLGKVKGNFTGSVFNMYTYVADSLEPFQVSATIFYSSEFFCNREKTREVQIYLKNKDCRYCDLAGVEIQKGRTLKDLYEIEANRGSKRISKYVTKQPMWNARLEMFTLNFHKRAKYASVKNAIFVRQGKPQNEVMLIGKSGQNQFAIEVSYPFSPMIALGVIITGFDFKLASQ